MTTPAFRGRSTAFGAAMRRSAEKRKCPKCGRKSAITRVSIAEDEFVAAYCRWEDCDYVRVRKHDTQLRETPRVIGRGGNYRQATYEDDLWGPYAKDRT